MWCCAPRWPASRRAAPRTPCGTNLSCCAPMASCTCSDMITPNPMNVPPCSACKMSCSAHGARSAGPPATGRGRKGPGDASMAWLVVAAIVATLLAGLFARAQAALRSLSPGRAPRVAPRRVLTRGRWSRDGAFGCEEDLRGLVDLLEQRRVIEPGEREMIHSVFELGDTIVREVMVPRTDIVFVERGKTLRQALSLALRSGFSRIPVVGENEDRSE